jgi:hypothetical protein
MILEYQTITLNIYKIQIATERYFAEVEDWVSPKVYGPIGKNSFLGTILHEIHLLADEPKDHQFMSVMRFSLMLAIVGPPYSGILIMIT